MTALSRIGMHLRSNVVGYLALAVASSGTAYAVPAIAKNSVRSPQIVNGQVKTADLGGNVVTGPKVKDNSLTGSDVANGTLAGADLKDGSVTGTDLADASVTGTDVKNGSLTSLDLAALDGLLLGASTQPAGGITLPGGQHLFNNADGDAQLDGDLRIQGDADEASKALTVGAQFCPKSEIYPAYIGIATEVDGTCYGSAFTLAGQGRGVVAKMTAVTDPLTLNPGAEGAYLYFEEDRSTNPDTLRLKVRWPNGTVSTITSGNDSDND